MTYGWPTDFPAVCSSGDYTKTGLMRHPHFEAAKKMGDRSAARILVTDLIDRNAVWAFGRRHSNARLIVVGRNLDCNQVPCAFAETVAEITGLPLDMGCVKKSNQAKHTGKSSMWRLLDRPKLEGWARTGASYILLDDVITQGGSVSELRQHLMRQGCRVVGIATLAHTRSVNFSDGIHVAQKPETRMSLTDKFNERELYDVLMDADVYEGNFSALTESEARLLLYYKNIESLKQAVDEERRRIYANSNVMGTEPSKAASRPAAR
jgi:hypothetical protein